MKFTKEQSFEQITALLGQTRYMSDRSINEQLDTLMPLVANDEMELSDFVAKVGDVFKITDSNVKHERSMRMKEPETTPAPIPTPTPSPSNGLTAEALTAAIQAAVTPLATELNALKGATATKELVSSAKGLFMSLKPDPERQSAIDLAYELATSRIDEGSTPESLSEAIKAKYDVIIAASGASTGYKPLESQGTGDGTNSELKNRLVELEAKDKEHIQSSSSVKGILGIETEIKK